MATKNFKPFVVVDFYTEKTVAPVPRTWLVSDSTCQWPDKITPGVTKLQKDKNSSPSTDWQSFPCRILANYGKQN